MRDVEINQENTHVRFHKRLWHDSELLLGRCYNFYYNTETEEMFCEIAKTSERAICEFIKLGFKNFNESPTETERKDMFFERLKSIYANLNNRIDLSLQAALPYYGMLYTHQKDVLYEAIPKKDNFLGMEMGTGKTITAASISRVCNIPRTVIMCPAAVKYNWLRDLTVKFGYNEIYFTVLDSTRKRTVRAFSERFVIINYDIIGNFERELCCSDIGHFIFDEAHNLKNHNSNRSKKVKAIVDKFPNARITFLSGTPVKNRVNDVFAYLKIVGHELGGNHKKFIEEYTITDRGRGGERVTGGKNLGDLNKRMANFMIRKTKEDCLDLPDKVYLSYRYEMDDYREKYDAVIKELSEQKEVSKLTGNLHSLNIITSMAKIPGIIALAESIIEEDRKVVIFGSYKEPLNLLKKHFGNSSVKIDGSVSAFDRDQHVQEFINNPDCKVFLGNMIAAGVGINLVNASDVIFINFPFTPAELYQAIDRCHRIGQSKSVNVHYTFCDDSIDEHIYNIIVDKEKDINALIDQGKEVVLRENTVEVLIKKLLKRENLEISVPEIISPLQEEEVVDASNLDDLERRIIEGELKFETSSIGVDVPKEVISKFEQAIRETAENQDLMDNWIMEERNKMPGHTYVNPEKKIVSGPEYYLMDDGDNLTIMNQPEFEEWLSQGEPIFARVFNHSDIVEVVKKGRHLSRHKTGHFDEAYTSNFLDERVETPAAKQEYKMPPPYEKSVVMANPMFEHEDFKTKLGEDAPPVTDNSFKIPDIFD